MVLHRAASMHRAKWTMGKPLRMCRHACCSYDVGVMWSVPHTSGFPDRRNTTSGHHFQNTFPAACHLHVQHAVLYCGAWA